MHHEAVDPTTYVYKVRQGVRFWDGTPLTAEDIAFAIERHRDPKLASLLAGTTLEVDSVTVTGDHEVTVKLSNPTVSWQYQGIYMLVYPKKLIKKLGKDFGAPGKEFMGTGPYKLTAFRAGGTLDFVANDDYWGQKPFAKKLTVQGSITDAQTALLAMRAGAADGTDGVSAFTLRDWKKIPDLTITSKPDNAPLIASFDLDAKPWDDVHVRRAFAYALDREGLFHAHAREGFYNEANYRNPEVDTAIKAAIASIDIQERAKLLAPVIKAAQEDLPYIPFWTRAQSVAMSNRFVYDGFSPPAVLQYWINHIKPAA